MDQASILIIGFMGPLILGCIIGIIWKLHYDKRQKVAH
jgi:hypothetical protein